jgi:UDP-N-acetylglucosamine--N-acetylmuramyl-(pentapeptide) pyrophosphoryl-undecaprenol N-acetylglucosamine transferase
VTTLLAANDGGHLVQLHSLVDRFGLEDDRLWVTVPTPQTESMLAGEQVSWVGPAPTRDWRAAARNGAVIHGLFRRHDITRAISTGSSLAVSTLPHAAVRRLPAHYIESVTRTDGFSLAGRMLRRFPGISLYAQWPHLAAGRWHYRGSTLDGYRAEQTEATDVRRIVVSVGTSSKYGFRRLLERLVAVVPDDIEVLWQTGCTDVAGLPIDANPAVPAASLAAAIAEADVVVAHAGAGIALTILEAGKVPILVPRRAAFAEHIDDHQGEIASRLEQLGLAFVTDAADLSWERIVSATGACVRRAEQPPRFRLDERLDEDGHR